MEQGQGVLPTPCKCEAGTSLSLPTRSGVPGLHQGDIGEVEALENKFAALSPRLTPQQSTPAHTRDTLASFNALCAQQDWGAVLDMKDEVKLFPCNTLSGVREAFCCHAGARPRRDVNILSFLARLPGGTDISSGNLVQAMKLAESTRLHNPLVSCGIYGKLGAAHEFIGDFPACACLLELATDIAQAKEDWESLSKALANLGRAYQVGKSPTPFLLQHFSLLSHPPRVLESCRC